MENGKYCRISSKCKITLVDHPYQATLYSKLKLAENRLNKDETWWAGRKDIKVLNNFVIKEIKFTYKEL